VAAAGIKDWFADLKGPFAGGILQSYLEGIAHFHYFCNGNSKEKGTRPFPSSFIVYERRDPNKTDRRETEGTDQRRTLPVPGGNPDQTHE
jgi:hypothetical protein